MEPRRAERPGSRFRCHAISAVRRGGTSAIEDFSPSLKLPEGIDVSRIDPTLKLDLLAKLRNVPMEGGARSVFEFSRRRAPPPKVAPIKPGPPVTPRGPPPGPAPSRGGLETGAPPAPPPIPLKFYGYVERAARRHQARVFPGRRRYLRGRRKRDDPESLQDRPHRRKLG